MEVSKREQCCLYDEAGFAVDIFCSCPRNEIRDQLNCFCSTIHRKSLGSVVSNVL